MSPKRALLNIVMLLVGAGSAFLATVTPFAGLIACVVLAIAALAAAALIASPAGAWGLPIGYRPKTTPSTVEGGL